jgi:dTDP-4-dehydrorhamnose 3,5-epimerase
MILMPPGFGNAFLVTSDYAVYNYKLAYDDVYNDHDKQFTYKWNDKKININWPIKDPILSNRDK